MNVKQQLIVYSPNNQVLKIFQAIWKSQQIS